MVLDTEIAGQQNQNGGTPPADGGQGGTPAGGDPGNQGKVFELDGEQVTAEQIKEWKSGHLMQADYTRKTQELARQQESLKPVLDLQNYLQSNPDKWTAINQVLTGDDPTKQELASLKQQQAQLFGHLGKIEAEAAIKEVKADPKYGGMFDEPGFEEALLATHMTKGRSGNLKETADEIFKVVVKREMALKQQTEKETLEKLKDPSRRGLIGSGEGFMPPKDFDPSKADWRDLDKAALSML